MSISLGASLGASDVTLTLANNGATQFNSSQPLPFSILLRRTSDGFVEIVRAVDYVSSTEFTIVRAQSGTTALAFTQADTADLLPGKALLGIEAFPVGSPALGTTTAVHAAVTLTSGTQNITTAITNPDVTRNVTITGNAGGNAGNVVIHGFDFNGKALDETIALSGSSTVVGTKAFSSITSFDLPIQTHVGTDTVSIGLGARLGLPKEITRDVITKIFLGSSKVPESVGSWTARFGSTLADCTAQLSSALNGTPVWIDYYPD